MSNKFTSSYFVCSLSEFSNRLKEKAEFDYQQELLKDEQENAQLLKEKKRRSQLSNKQRQQEDDKIFQVNLEKGFYDAMLWVRSLGKYNHCHIWLGETNTHREEELARAFAKNLKDKHGYEKAYFARDFEYDCMRNCIYIDSPLFLTANRVKRKQASDTDEGSDSKKTKVI